MMAKAGMEVLAGPAAVAVDLLLPVEESGLNLVDQQLVERCLTGDAGAWDQVIRDHSRRIYNLCLRFTGRPEDAEDLSQEVFIRVYRNLASYRAADGSLKTWIGSVTRNLLIDHYRRTRNLRQTDSLDDEESRLTPPVAQGRPADAGVWSREIQESVQRALTRLSPELREAVILRDLQDLDYREIAEMLHVPEGTVKSRINRGRIELARMLKRRFAAGS
jgi:RNA polymerase sigma-70 factor (ECF subfamily)